MADARASAKPLWQTDELLEEWIDEDDELGSGEPQATIARDAHTASDLSFTQPLNSMIGSDNSGSIRQNRSSGSAGTVVVHSDAEDDGPLLPQTPAAKKIMSKDLFSPLPLEKMFEPPSPPSPNPPPVPPPRTSAPAIPSRLSQVYIPGENDTTSDFDSLADASVENSPSTRKSLPRSQSQPETNYQFTFAAPQPDAFSRAPSSQPNAQSTPLPPFTPMRSGGDALQLPFTDPRLRLFQFQYDTFTREHLSAMVDSIAVNTPSGGSGTAGSKETTPAASSQNDSMSRMRSAKRLKLSPASDFSEYGDGAAVILRPQSRKDYVGESKSLMEKIRQARDFSTISTQGNPQTPANGQQDRSQTFPSRNGRESWLQVTQKTANRS
jgi:protein NUD1